MLNLFVFIQRNAYTFREGFTEKAVQEYQKELNALKVKLEEGWDFQSYFFYSKELYEQIKREVAVELAYCEFFLTYMKRKQSEANFAQWVFTPRTAESLTDSWSFTNGKVKAIINIVTTGAMFKLHLKYVNDSRSELQFYSCYYAPKYDVVMHARNPESVKVKIAELKIAAVDALNNFQFPILCTEKKQFDFLNGLLCVQIREVS